MSRLLPLRRMLVALIAACLLGTPALARQAPEFHQTSPEEWLNSAPLTMADLRGEVVLLHFWAFSCWNCYRSFPWLNQLEAGLSGEKFRVIGVHSPEFRHEHDRSRVEAKIKEFGLKHAVVMDNQFIHWRKYHNRYWPAYYLIDARGVIRRHFVGETHAGDTRAKRIESEIRKLLAKA